MKLRERENSVLKMQFIIMKNNIRQLKLHVALAVIFLISIPTFLTISYLSENEIIYLAEHYICLIGILLLVPVFLAEDNKYIKELLLSKKMPLTLIWIKRIFLQIVFLSIMIFAILKIFQLNSCTFLYFKVYYIAFANAIFLGGLGIIGCAIFNSWIIGYLLPLCYYMLSLFLKNNTIIKTFTLFSNQNQSLKEKHFLLMTGIGCIIISLVYLEKTKKIIKES